jgi:hypothetical protein
VLLNGEKTPVHAARGIKPGNVPSGVDPGGGGGGGSRRIDVGEDSVAVEKTVAHSGRDVIADDIVLRVNS